MRGGTDGWPSDDDEMDPKSVSEVDEEGGVSDADDAAPLELDPDHTDDDVLDAIATSDKT